MKKLFVLLGVFCALCFVACSNFQLAGGDMGVVSLSIGDNLAREIRSAAASRNVADGTYTLTASIRGEYSDSQTVAVANGNYSGVTFTFEDVPVGKNIILDLTAKADGNYIWYGNSGKHTVEQGENLLTIALGRVSGVLMWKDFSVKIAPYGNYEAGSSIQNPKTPPVWCFDAQGNLYVLDANGGGMRYNLQADGTYPSENNATYSGLTDFWAFACDNDEGVVYGIHRDGLYRLVESNNPTLVATHDIIDCVGFAVHNNIIYTATFNAVENEGWKAQVTLSKYEVDSGGGDPSSQKIITLPDVFLTISRSAPTGQMIYHEGALYLLLGSFSVSSSITHIDTAEVQSCGALLRINPSTLTLDTSFGSNGYLGLASERTISGTYDSDPYSMKLYSPTESNESRAFYGPVGFVAVMPKKLVIADAGYALSKGSDDKLLARRKNRVVTVDLETQAFDVASLSDTPFYGNITTGCGFLVVK